MLTVLEEKEAMWDLSLNAERGVIEPWQSKRFDLSLNLFSLRPTSFPPSSI